MIRKLTLLSLVLLLVGSVSVPVFAQDPIIIDFWIPAGRGRDEGTAAVVEAFEAANPNIQVEVTAIPFGEFLNTLQVALAGNNPRMLH